MPDSADCDVISRCKVLGQAAFIMGQTSRCCIICPMPQSQVSGSFGNPHFNIERQSLVLVQIKRHLGGIIGIADFLNELNFVNDQTHESVAYR